MPKRRPIPKPTRLQRIKKTDPGFAPGSVTPPAGSKPTVLDAFGFDREKFEERKGGGLDRALQLRDSHSILWLDFDGLQNAELVRQTGDALGLHKLTVEDIVHPHQRAKVEYFEGYIFIVVQMVSYEERLEREQLSLVLGKNFVVTFQEGRPGDCLDPVRDRLRAGKGVIRSSGSDYLSYAILDAVTDHYFPVMERYADELERLEDQVSHRPYLEVVWRLHGIRRELLQLQTSLSPQRDLVQSLIREACPLLTDDTRVHLRDVADHQGQLLDLLHAYRDMAQALIEIHLNVASNRMNEVMQVLTIIGAIFMPLSFLAGLYGMNFDAAASPLNMPELRWKYGYVATLVLMSLIALGQLYFFRRKGWLGKR